VISSHGSESDDWPDGVTVQGPVAELRRSSNSRRTTRAAEMVRLESPIVELMDGLSCAPPAEPPDTDPLADGSDTCIATTTAGGPLVEVVTLRLLHAAATAVAATHRPAMTTGLVSDRLAGLFSLKSIRGPAGVARSRLACRAYEGKA